CDFACARWTVVLRIQGAGRGERPRHGPDDGDSDGRACESRKRIVCRKCRLMVRSATPKVANGVNSPAEFVMGNLARAATIRQGSAKGTSHVVVPIQER